MAKKPKKDKDPEKLKDRELHCLEKRLVRCENSLKMLNDLLGQPNRPKRTTAGVKRHIKIIKDKLKKTKKRLKEIKPKGQK